MSSSRITQPPPPGYPDNVINPDGTGPVSIGRPPTSPGDYAFVDPKLIEGRKQKKLKPSGEISVLHEIFQEAENEYGMREFQIQEDAIPSTRPSAVNTKKNPRDGLTPSPDGPRDGGGDKSADTRREGNAAKPKSHSRPSYNWTPKLKEFESSFLHEIFMEAESEWASGER